jgi:hypothetical protein
MPSLSKSPERHTFQKNGYIERCLKEGKVPDPSIVSMYESWASQPEYENRPVNDLEYDLRTTSWILAKVRESDRYAQNLYAAMCNMTWQSREFWQELKGETWSCSWRHAGGIIADMQQKGDYIDWYCSGMGGLNQEYDGEESNETWQKRTGYVPEGTVTEEIELDLNKLGWRPVPYTDDI